MSIDCCNECDFDNDCNHDHGIRCQKLIVTMMVTITLTLKMTMNHDHEHNVVYDHDHDCNQCDSIAFSVDYCHDHDRGTSELMKMEH